MSDPAPPACPECTAPLAFVDRGGHRAFACERCGGMFEPAVIVEATFAAYLEVVEQTRRITRATVAPETELEAAAAAHDLFYEPDTYRPIDAEPALAQLGHLLEQDMAYDSRLMEPADAAACAVSLLSPLVAMGARYYTNRLYLIDEGRLVSSWNPATGATFDCGVLAVTAELSACLWFEDED